MTKLKIKEYNRIIRAIDKRIEIWNIIKKNKEENKNLIKQVLKELKYLKDISEVIEDE